MSDAILTKAALSVSAGQLTAMANKLAGARFAFHRVVHTRYHEAVQRRELTPEQGKEAYRKAMNNYDDVIKGCADGHFNEGNARVMADDYAAPYAYAPIKVDA
jgi:hypothetical protein